MKILFLPILLYYLFIAAPVFSQEAKPDAKTEKKNEVETARMKRQKAKKEWREKRREDRANLKAIRQHEKKLQTRDTRRKMRKDRRRADRINRNKKEFILIRLFKPKPKTGAW